jgi:hypothetical protein
MKKARKPRPKDLPAPKHKGVTGGALNVGARLQPMPPPISPVLSPTPPPITPAFQPTPPPITPGLQPTPPPI